MFYVYQHIRLDTGEIFYIGKGTAGRAWSKHNRNKHWKHIVNSVGYRVEILQEFESENQAFNVEKQLIKSLNPSCNFAEGGHGGNTFDGLPEERKEQIRLVMKQRALDPNGGVAKAARLRKGKTKNIDFGLRSMAESHSMAFAGEGNPMYGKSHWHTKTIEEANEIKRRTSKTLKQTYKNNPRKYKRVKCPHCGKIGGQPGMTRYHFDNCKEKK